jgi:predicted transport protein
MPLFQIEKNGVTRVIQTNFSKEKELQFLVEQNLQVVFNCRLVASEFSTSAQHAGRIDSLALSEDNNPVIIEYKKVESSDLINQSLFYLSWLDDHRGDFEIAAKKTLGDKVTVDWSDIRVICIAPNYRKYDLHAVQVMGANIELWSYRLFKNSMLYLEEVFHKTVGSSPSLTIGTKDAKMVAAGKKAAATRAAATYTFEEHLNGKPEKIRSLVLTVQEFIMGLDPSMEQAPKKFHVAYKIAQNIVCMEVRKSKITLFLKLDPKKVKGPPGISRDVSEIGHYGTGDLEITLRTEKDLDNAKTFIEMAYKEVGG